MNTDMDIDINTVTDTITCRLVEARADLGITQKELALATGISLKTIANIESKQHIPSLLYCHASNYSSHLRQLFRRLIPTSPFYRLS